MSQNMGIVKSIDTRKMDDVAKNFQKNVTLFSTAKIEVEKIVSTLLLNWTGDAKVEFQTQFELIYGKLGDIEKALEEFYEGLLEAEIVYREMDDELAKAFQENAEKVNISITK